MNTGKFLGRGRIFKMKLAVEDSKLSLIVFSLFMTERSEMQRKELNSLYRTEIIIIIMS